MITSRTAHAGDVGAGITHKTQIVDSELAGERNEQAGVVCLNHPRAKSRRRHQPAQPGTELVGRVEQHASGTGLRRRVDECEWVQTRSAIRIGVGDGDYSRLFGGAIPSRGNERGDASARVNS